MNNDDSSKSCPLHLYHWLLRNNGAWLANNCSWGLCSNTYVNPNSHNNYHQCRTTSNDTYLPWKKIPLLLLFLFLFTFIRCLIENIAFLTFSTDWQITCHTPSVATFSAGPVTNLPNNKHTVVLITLRADSVANISINVHVIRQFARLALLSCGIQVDITGAILIAVNINLNFPTDGNREKILMIFSKGATVYCRRSYVL